MSTPDWRAKADELERQDRLEEAEKVIHDALHPNYPAAQATAQMYRDRAVRLLNEGRIAEAAAAREKAIEWIDRNTSYATSGGEAMALLHSADQFKRGLPSIPRTPKSA